MLKKRLKRYKVNNDFIQQRIEGELVGLDVKTSHFYTFNKTAEYIFRKIKLGLSKEEIALTMVKKYKIPLQTVKKDIATVIDTMIKYHIFK